VSNNSSAETVRLAELLEKELETCGLIRELTKKQTELLAMDDIEAFNESLDERERLIEKIKGLHQDSNPLMQSYVNLTAGGSDKVEKIEDLKKQIHKIFEECNDINKKNITAMDEKIQGQSVKIDEQKAKRVGIGGYAQSVPNTSEMFDKKT